MDSLRYKLTTILAMFIPLLNSGKGILLDSTRPFSRRNYYSLCTQKRTSAFWSLNPTFSSICLEDQRQEGMTNVTLKGWIVQSVGQRKNWTMLMACLACQSWITKYCSEWATQKSRTFKNCCKGKICLELKLTFGRWEKLRAI